MLVIKKSLFAVGRMQDERRQKKALKRLLHRKFSPFLAFGIFLPHNDDDLFEIISFNELRKDWYHDTDLKFIMIGIAETSEDAIRLVTTLYLAKEKVRREEKLIDIPPDT